MFELSLVEILFIVLVALVIMGPEEVPNVLRKVMKAWRQVGSIAAEVRSNLDAIADESGMMDIGEEIKKEAKYIIDQNGEAQEVFEVADLMEIHVSKNPEKIENIVD